jgi:flagellar hook-associated protein FlgK
VSFRSRATDLVAGLNDTNGTWDLFVVQSVRVFISDVSISEGDSGTTNFTFTVSLSWPGAQAVTVQYTTADDTATDTVTAGTDYTGQNGILTFLPNQPLSQIITIAISGDDTFEADETFFVNLASPTNALIADNQGVGTIVNDDTAPRDVRLLDLSVTGSSTLSLTYEIVDAAPDLLEIGLYSSADTSFGGDSLLNTISIGDANNLSVGTHTIIYTIGGAVGQVALPGAGLADTEADYYLLAVADHLNTVSEDDLDPFNEDNTIVFVWGRTT